MSKETLADKVERLRKDNRRKRDLIRKLRKQLEESTLKKMSDKVDEFFDGPVGPSEKEIHDINHRLYQENATLANDCISLRGMVDILLRECKKNEQRG